MHDYYPRSWSQSHSHACFAPRSTAACSPAACKPAAEDAAPRYCRHHHSASVPLCCLLPVTLTAVSRALRPEERGEIVSTLQLKLMFTWRKCGFDPSGAHARRAGNEQPSVHTHGGLLISRFVRRKSWEVGKQMLHFLLKPLNEFNLGLVMLSRAFSSRASVFCSSNFLIRLVPKCDYCVIPFIFPHSDAHPCFFCFYLTDIRSRAFSLKCQWVRPRLHRILQKGKSQLSFLLGWRFVCCLLWHLYLSCLLYSCISLFIERISIPSTSHTSLI